MLARRDTRIEAARLRRLSPLQTVEDQSPAWGICCHSCTWREGFTPSWQTELQGSSLPRGLPGSRSFLSINGSHFHECRVDLPATGGQHLLHSLTRSEDHPVTDAYQAPAPRRFDDLRIEQLGQRHPARLGHRACSLAARRLYPGAEMAQQRGPIFLQPVGQEQRDATRREYLHDLMDNALGHGLRARANRARQQQLALRVDC